MSKKKAPRHPAIEIRQTRPEDFPGIIALTRKVYPTFQPYCETQLESQLEKFPEA